MNFKQAEKRFKQLKTQFISGTLNETEFKTQLEKLMIRDESGCWWMIGYETEKWYRHDGKEWVQVSLPASQTQSSPSIPRWTSILWIILGWSAGWAFGTVIHNALKLYLSFEIRLALSGLISGTIGGIVTVLVLKNEEVPFARKNIIWVTLAWMLGSLIGWTNAMVFSLAIGGLVLALVLRVENRLPDWNSVILIALAWVIGSDIAGTVKLPIAGNTGWLASMALGGALAGAIGGLVTIWQLRYEKRVNE